MPVRDCLNVVQAFSIAVPGDCPLVNVCEKVPPTPIEGDIEGVIDILGVTEGVLLILGVTLGVTEGVLLILGVTLGVTLGVIDILGVTLGVTLGVIDILGVTLGVALVVIDGVLLTLGVTVRLGVTLGVTEGVITGTLLSISFTSFNCPSLLLLRPTKFPVPFVLINFMGTNQSVIINNCYLQDPRCKSFQNLPKYLLRLLL